MKQCVSLRIVFLTIPEENREGMHMYIHAYIFLWEFIHYICPMSEAQFENVEQNRKEQALLNRMCLKG